VEFEEILTEVVQVVRNFLCLFGMQEMGHIPFRKGPATGTGHNYRIPFGDQFYITTQYYAAYSPWRLSGYL